MSTKVNKFFLVYHPDKQIFERVYFQKPGQLNSRSNPKK